MSQGKCPICTYKQVESDSSRDGSQYICPRCGRYRITRNAYEDYSRELPSPKLSAWIRGLNEGGSPNPLLKSTELNSVVENLPDYSVPQKQLILLRVIENRSKFKPGDGISLNKPVDYPLAWCRDEIEFQYLIQELKNRGLLEELGGASGIVECRITTTGWEYLEEQPNDKSFGKISHEYINEQASKCDKKIADGDNDGAITSARTLVEAVLNEILMKNGEDPHNFDGNLLKLYKQAQNILDFAPSNKDVDDTLNQYLRGLTGVVSGLSGLRNKMSDSHARKVKPEKHHAKLAVDSAKTLAEFLFEEMVAKQDKVSSRT